MHLSLVFVCGICMIDKVSKTAPVPDPMTSTKTEKHYSISWPKASLVDVIPDKKMNTMLSVT